MKSFAYTAIREALDALRLVYEPNDVQMERPRIEAHGDLSTNVAMVLARRLKRSPREIAKNIIEAMKIDTSVADVEIAGAGFINFRFRAPYVMRQLESILTLGDDYGRSSIVEGKKANVEWVSANPTGPLHAGHGRQVCLGETICCLLEWTGWDVTREYYFNNAGNQMNNLGRSIQLRYLQALGDEISFDDHLYHGDYIRVIAGDLVRTHGSEKRKEDVSFFRKVGEEICFEMIRRSLDRLSVKHDIYYNEDSLYSDGSIADVIAVLRERELAYDKDGAVWLKATGLGLEQDRVMIKSSGEPTYRLPDIAYHREKIRRGYDLIVDIFGADHVATIPDVLAGVKALGYSTEQIRVVIHQMVSFVNEGETVKMSKRSANVYSLDDLIDDVGVDAVRYFFVMRSVNSHLDFDLALAREQSENNPVYYLQYAHARIASILRFARTEGFDLDAEADYTLLCEESEVELTKALLDFPEIVASCAETFEPHRLCTYLHDTATRFHKFYHECRVVTEDKNMTIARLSLCRAARLVIQNGLRILGITAPEQM